MCWHGGFGCAGDIRLYDLEERGRGLVRPVLWTARNGSTVSGHVWATREGPAKRPGIVDHERLDPGPGAPLLVGRADAREGGYVVTWDPQNQGLSDTLGRAWTRRIGVPAQATGNKFLDL